PQGEIGPQGLDGDDGDDGSDGSDGAQGPTGPQGPSGADGAACWDLNGNGTGDLPDEDINGDLVVDVLDCAGPQGPDGPQGIQGPPGPGSLMAYASSATHVTIEMWATCTHFGLSVTIDVPSDGYVVVSATTWLSMVHTAGTDDVWVVMIADSPTECSQPADYRYQETISEGNPSDTAIWRTAAPQNVFSVTPGSYTFYVNGAMFDTGAVDDQFWRGNVVAVFYPS
ncbi:MAG: hypothetical protein LN415_03370, partial [Candidatus Thermoplasmatota archaeon]|nr:hypothetical protein [Candidatus Thermoplasmatota archaeon]